MLKQDLALSSEDSLEFKLSRNGDCFLKTQASDSH